MSSPGLTSQRVDRFHADLLKTLRKHLILSDRSSISESTAFEQRDWTKARADSKIEFHLLDKVSYEFGERNRGGRVPVFRFRTGTGWGSWYEKWFALGRGYFRLDSIGFTLWRGDLGATKSQIIRAEWDHVNEVERKRAAQPHWHLDVPVADLSASLSHEGENSLSKASFSEKSASLSDNHYEDLHSEIEVFGTLQAQTIDMRPTSPGRSISAYHLGMSGRWFSKSTDRGWRHRWNNELEGIPDWLDLCLEYLTHEISASA